MKYVLARQRVYAPPREGLSFWQTPAPRGPQPGTPILKNAKFSQFSAVLQRLCRNSLLAISVVRLRPNDF